MIDARSNGSLTSWISTNLMIILGMMQVTKKIPFEDENVLNLVRAIYIGSNLIIAGLYFYIQLQINKKKGKGNSHSLDYSSTRDGSSTPSPMSPDRSMIAANTGFSLDMTTLKYVEPAPMGSSEEGKLVTTTICAYDLNQLRQAWRGQLMGIAMMSFMHMYMKYTNPLVIQSIIPVKSVIESNLFKIHVLGHAASGDLKRPFKQAQGFMSAMQQGGGSVQSDKKAVEAAEKAGRGGAKEE